jgi:hypothetical protein
MGSHKLLDVEDERVEAIGIEDIAIFFEVEGEICGKRRSWRCALVRESGRHKIRIASVEWNMRLDGSFALAIYLYLFRAWVA